MADVTLDKITIEIEGSANKANKVIEDLEKNMKNLKSAMGGFNTSSLDNLVSKLENAANKANNIKVNSVSTKIDTSGLSKAEKQIESSLSSIKDRITSIQPLFEAALSGDASSATSFNRKAMSIEGDIDVLKSKLEELKDVKLPTEEFTNLDNSIETSKATIEDLLTKEKEMSSSGVSQDSTEWLNLQAEIGNAKDELNGFIAQQDQMKAEGTNMYNPFESYGASLDGLESKLGTARVAVAGLQDSANDKGDKFSAIKSGLDSVISKASSAAIKLATLTGSGIVNGFKGLASRLSSVKQTLTSIGNSSVGKVKNGFMTILKYGLGIRSLYVLFRRLRTAITDSFTQLQKSGAFYETTKENVESLKTSLLTLKYQFGAAFEPIFNYIAPALETLINKVISATNTLSAFIAKLTGKSTYSKVLSVTAAVTESTKKLNKALQGFDELNNLTTSDSNKTEESATYTTASVDSALSDFANNLITELTNGNWSKVGSTISSKLTEVLEGIPWSTIYQKAANFGSGLADFLNGLINKDLFSALGTTIGNSIKAALTFLDNFGTTFDWTNFGESIAAGINSFVKSNPLKLAVKTFNTWANGILDTLIAAIDNISWSDISTHIAEAIADIDTKGLGTKLGKLVNSITNAIYELVANKDTWTNLGTKLAEGINSFVSTTDWGKVSFTLSKFVSGLISAVSTFIEKTDWSAVGDSIVTMISNIDWEELLGNATVLLAAITSGILQLFLGIGSSIAGDIADAFESVGLDSAAGFFRGIEDNIKESTQWVKDTFQKIIDAVKDFFGIASPSKTFKEIGGYLIDGLKEGILTAITGIKDWLKENVINKITEAWDALKDFTVSIKSKFEDTKEKIAEKWDAIKSGVSDTVDVAVGLAKDGWTTITGWLNDVAQKGKDVVDKAVSLAKNGWTTITGWLSSAAQYGSEALSAAVDLAKNGWSTVKGWVGNATQMGSDAVDAAVGLAKDGWESIKSWVNSNSAEKKVESLVALAKSGWESIKSWVNNNSAEKKVESLVALTKSGWTKISDWVDSNAGAKKVSALINLEKSGWTKLADWVSNNAIAKKVSSYVELAKSGWNKLGEWVTKNAGSSYVKALVKLVKKGWKSLIGFIMDVPNKVASSVTAVVSVGVKLFKSGWSKIKDFFGLSNGGILGANGGVKLFGEGGSIVHEIAHNWNIPKFANGNVDPINHGTLFVAGERGPEIMGHINGRTEILNRSQIASTVFTAITNGMRQFRNAQLASPPQIALTGGAVASLNSFNGGYNDSAAIEEQNRLLAEQNRLLQIIADKDTRIAPKDIFEAARSESYNFYQKTGNSSPFSF